MNPKRVRDKETFGEKENWERNGLILEKYFGIL